MIKHYCDRCEGEVEDKINVYIYRDGYESKVDLCDKCMIELKYFLSPLKGVKNDNN